MTRPLLLATMGDPAGIGPEITARAVLEAEVREACRPLVIGDVGVMESALALVGSGASVNPVSEPEEAAFREDAIDVMGVAEAGGGPFRLGEVQAEAGRAAFAYIRRAIVLAMEGRGQAVVTAPINKESLRAGGVPYIGHTEMLADLTGAGDAMTMFTVRGLKIFFLTRHVSLAEAIRQLSPQSVLDGIRKSMDGLAQLGVERPRLAVAGLNPHAGEGGLFGDEEVRAVRPAVGEARRSGLDVTGPVPADSVFHQALGGRYDAVLALYHDQGHIAAKMTDFERTVSVTLGLPILRTSVDHGTAFDIAGKGVASAVSMAEALRVTADLLRSGIRL